MAKAFWHRWSENIYPILRSIINTHLGKETAKAHPFNVLPLSLQSAKVFVQVYGNDDIKSSCILLALRCISQADDSKIFHSPVTIPLFSCY